MGAQSAYGAAAGMVGMRGIWWKLLTGLWMAATILAAYLKAGPAEGFPFPDGARIIFFHVPCAWFASLSYLLACGYGIAFLRTLGRQGWEIAQRWDLRTSVSMELGFLFAALTTVSGSIFSRLEWGAYWSWDPRQTSILVILLIFAAYLVLRGAVTDPETRARLSAVYALVAVVPGTFLIWVLPRIVYTLHGDANRAVIGGNIGNNYRTVLYAFALPAFIGLFTWMFQLRLRQEALVRRFHET